MSRLSIKLGYWSAVLSAILTIGWGIGLVMAIILFPVPSWTNLAGYVAAIRPASLVAATLTQAAAFLLGPLSLILLCSLHDYAPGDKKILTRIGLCCIIATGVRQPDVLCAFQRDATDYFQRGPHRVGAVRGMESRFGRFGEWPAGLDLLLGIGPHLCRPHLFGRTIGTEAEYTSLICGSCGILGTLGYCLKTWYSCCFTS